MANKNNRDINRVYSGDSCRNEAVKGLAEKLVDLFNRIYGEDSESDCFNHDDSTRNRNEGQCDE